MSLTGKRWLEPKIQLPLSGVADAIAAIARARGLDTSAPPLSDPFLFAEMGRAVDRIRDALSKKEKIAIFGDYDADGITAAAQLLRFFRRHDGNAEVILPHREKDGYGLKQSVVDDCLKKGVSLLITVDNGITYHEEIAYAQFKGIDVIVTDHHAPKREKRPPAHSVIHPLVPAAFPNPYLSGSGVALMLVCAMEQVVHGSKDRTWPGFEEDFALATIGTVADLVPLLGENRTLVQFGLRCMDRLSTQSPLAQLMNQVRKNGESLTSGDIAYRLAPQINASGRIADPALALEALINGGGAVATLQSLNEERKSLTNDVVATVEASLDTAALFLCVKCIGVSPGIVGLIAGRLTADLGKPSFVATEKNGICTASLRSPDTVDLTTLTDDSVLQHLFSSYGGHAQAAGCAFATDNFDAIKTRLQERMSALGFTEDTTIPATEIIAELPYEFLTADFAGALGALEPFGRGNAEPRFLLKNQMLSGIKYVGTDRSHLQCSMSGVRAIGFYFGNGNGITERDRYDIVFRLAMNAWNGNENLQIVIEDMRRS